MSRTLRHVLMSTSLGVAAIALTLPGAGGALAQDGSSCMQDVQMLRDEPSVGKGGDSTIAASAAAAEEACRTGDYALASAYVADGERRANLREAQRDDAGTTEADRADGALGAGATGLAGARADSGLGNDDDDSVGDDVESAANDVGNDIEDTAEDVGDEASDIANDIGDEASDFGNDVEDAFD
jgi:hypothetical protein